jgi:hypothetical protein
MKALVIVATLIGPTWYNYAIYNAHYTALLIGIPNTQIECKPPGDGDLAKCTGNYQGNYLVMRCPVSYYGGCRVWLKTDLANIKE